MTKKLLPLGIAIRERGYEDIITEVLENKSKLSVDKIVCSLNDMGFSASSDSIRRNLYIMLEKGLVDFDLSGLGRAREGKLWFLKGQGDPRP